MEIAKKNKVSIIKRTSTVLSAKQLQYDCLRFFIQLSTQITKDVRHLAADQSAMTQLKTLTE